MAAAYPETDGSRQFVKGTMDNLLGAIITTLEKIKGKAADNCHQLEATTNPSLFKSFYFPVFKAVDNLEQLKNAKIN